MERIILHIDMDCFFAQIEERENPRFKGKPVVVGADPEKGRGRGVVSTANYIAREYGIHSALPISEAYRLCPGAVFLQPDMGLYKKVSESIFEIVKGFSPRYEIVSLDEAYLDVSFLKSYKKAKTLAKRLKEEIFKKEELTSTIGIGPNKLISKIAAQKVKPDGLFAVKPNKVVDLLDPLDIQEIPGIGVKTAQRLGKLGVSKIRELKGLSKKRLEKMFGKVGKDIYEKARGIDNREVSNEDAIKSIGKEYTFRRDTREPEIIFEIFGKIIKEVHQQLLDNHLCFRTVTVVCRFSGFETHTKSKTFNECTDSLSFLEKESKKLLLRFLVESPKSIRLVGIRVSRFNLKK